ncbi:hypothetical protein M9H77_26762 [Catharanthus roseus]|uniref:Uncharacterized protein n=1 Tax=Catharanthus roseus TaxID=4058 RepID=A0ACC0AAW8_CATRO|nr:hypothetical protein M9H77_26762 [Catharanthus roseus]
MEQVPAYVHPGPIVPDVLSRQHEHISIVHCGFGRCTTDWGGLSLSLDLGVVAYTCIAASANDGDSDRPSCSSWRNMWRFLVRDGPAVAAEALSYPSDEYIRWYRVITQVYIGNPANRDTRVHGYQPAGVDRQMMNSMLQEVDDMASVVIREPPSSPSQMAVVMKKV